jgi:hypothetical protein
MGLLAPEGVVNSDEAEDDWRKLSICQCGRRFDGESIAQVTRALTRSATWRRAHGATVGLMRALR